MEYICPCGKEYILNPKEIPLSADENVFCDNCGCIIKGLRSTRYFDYEPVGSCQDASAVKLTQPWTKVEIIHHLSEINGYKNYLEVVTPSTGLAYANIDRSRFETCHRLMYRCPEGFDDGMEIDFRTNELDISKCVKEIKHQRTLYDIILIDSWHEYETSFRDLKDAFDLVRVGGSLVVHDCLPPNEEVATPYFIPGGWAGLTYKAYLDFVLKREDLRYFTVDTDWGCGVITKLQRKAPLGRNLKPLFKSTLGRSILDARPRSSESNALIEDWMKISDNTSAYRFVLENKRALFRSLTVDEFVTGQAV